MRHTYTSFQNFLYEASFIVTALRLRYLWPTLFVFAEAIFWRVIFIFNPNNFHLLGMSLIVILNVLIITIGLILVIGTAICMLMDTFLGGD